MLSDKDIKSRLPDIQLQSADLEHPFDPDAQISSCSIDLRLSPTVWLPKPWRFLDLSTKHPWGAAISNAFRQRSIGQKGILLHPGQFLLGRTLETFEIPKDLVGRLTGRSSVGRLGISVVAPSDYINPGWRGHMPLMIINHSPFFVRLYPTLSVVQLCFLKLSSPSERIYGAETGAKYQDDDGGPSKYWLDWSVRLLRQRIDARTAGPREEQMLGRFSASLDEATRRRFAEALRKYGKVSEVSDFVEFFVRRERRRSSRLLLLPWLLSIPTALILKFADSLWGSGNEGKAALVAILAGALFLAWRLYRENTATMFSVTDLRKLAKEAES